ELRGEGGRVTELAARPLLELFFPEAAAFRQPLAGECAARRSVLERIPFCTGYGVEIAMLVDLVEAVGVERMAQVDLGRRRNPNQPLRNLAEMARDVAAALLARVEGMPPDAAERASGRLVERPPLATWAAERGLDSRALPSGTPAADRGYRVAPDGDPLRLHGPRRHPARPGGLALPRPRGQLQPAPGAGAGGMSSR